MKTLYENRSYHQNIPVSLYENDNFSFVAHWHNDVEIAIVKKGSIYSRVNNDRRKLVEGDMVVCSSGEIHSYESGDEPSNIILLIFKPEFIGNSYQWPENRQFITPFITNEVIKNSRLTDVYEIVNSIKGEIKEKKAFYEIFVKMRIIELCGTLLRYSENFSIDNDRESKFSPDLQLMQDIIMYIQENYTQNISLKDIAKEYHIDFFNLSKKFNSIVGMNFKAYINALRIMKAESMIANSSMPLMDIAFECGFNSIRNFNRVFKSIKTSTPSNSRENKRKS